MRRIRIGLQLPQQNVAWEDLSRAWRDADELGYDSAWVFDHLLPIFSDVRGPCFEAWTALAALAALSKRIRVGCLVTANTFRSPALLAKMATTVDHLSGGRLIFGIGGGWFEEEHRAYALGSFGRRERIERLREAVELIRLLWTQDETNFHGRYYAAVRAPFEPKPLQQPHPPIWIGGRGRRWTLPIVAELADGWNATPFYEPASFAELSSELDSLCRKRGREPAEIERSYLVPMHLSRSGREAEDAVRTWAAGMGMPFEKASEIALWGDEIRVYDRMCAFREAGVSHFVLSSIGRFEASRFRSFAERIIPRFR